MSLDQYPEIKKDVIKDQKKRVKWRMKNLVRSWEGKVAGEFSPTHIIHMQKFCAKLQKELTDLKELI